MRIDYSEPKQSYVTGQIKARPRKEPKRFLSIVAVFAVFIAFIVGFGTGWFFSQKSAKKSFQAATEQSSLENTPSPYPQQASQIQNVSQPVPVQPQQSPAGPVPPLPAAADAPLTFYKNLSNEQKENVIGSGINNRNETSKQPIQAAIPSNLAKPVEKNEPGQEVQAEKKQEKYVQPAANAGGFVVQVGSYTLKSEAEILKNKLTAKGYNVSVSESNQGEKGIWYRVRIGKKLEKEAARELASRIGKGAVVIPDRD